MHVNPYLMVSTYSNYASLICTLTQMVKINVNVSILA